MVEFRTKYNPGSYTDYEHYEPGTSLTEPGQAETMEQLMSRMTRERFRPIALGPLDDKEVDDLLEDADLDELEDEGRTGMASALDDFAEVVNAGEGSTAGTEAKEKQNVSDATTTTNAHADGALDGSQANEG